MGGCKTEKLEGFGDTACVCDGAFAAGLRFDWFVQGFTDDKVRWLLCALAAYPLAIGFQVLRNESLRHVYGLIVGFFFGWWCFGSQV